eukprot:TRINITY_DN11386_c0_g1_i1.p1 TRINITY_DN11386_c0_g1~~TRINITY_DN11386_c0_g1_i1.p1  ORF type:complete len:379 (+),score=94.86 TRINITY_DN11386_c0_g1_i1:47-1183(+)
MKSHRFHNYEIMARGNNDIKKHSLLENQLPSINIEPQPSCFLVESFHRWKERWKDMSLLRRSYLLLAILNYLSLAALALEPLLDRPAPPPAPPLADPLLTRTLIFLTIIIFQILHLWNGIFNDNIYEIYATMLTQLCISLIISMRSIWVLPLDLPYSGVLVGYGAVFQVVYLVYLYPLYRAHKWTFYRKAGAEVEKRKKYKSYLLFHVFLKLDFMMNFVSVLVFTDFDDYTSVAVSCGVLTLVYYLIGRFAVTTEFTPLICSFWCFSLISPIFIAFGIYEIIKYELLKPITISTITAGPSTKTSYAYLFVATGALSVLSRTLLLIQSIAIYRNFGEQLADFEKKQENYWDQNDQQEDTEPEEDFEEPDEPPSYDEPSK